MNILSRPHGLPYILIFLLSPSQTSLALEKVSFNIDDIITNDWHVKGLSASLSNVHNKNQKLSLSIKELILPEPFSKLKLVSVTCQSVTWQNNKIICDNGEGRLKSTLISHSPFNLAFSIAKKNSYFYLKNLPFAKGTFSLSAKEKMGEWSVSIKSKKIQLQQLTSFIKNYFPTVDEISKGSINANLNLLGKDSQINKLSVKTAFNNISFQAEQGDIATDALSFKINLTAIKKKSGWKWEQKAIISAGEVYKKPIYIAIEKDKEVQIQTNGFSSNKGSIKIYQADLRLPNVIDINTEGSINIKPSFTIKSAKIRLNIKDLKYISTHFLSPNFEQTALDGFNFNGQLISEIELSNSETTKFRGQFNNFSINDLSHRIELHNSNAKINWSASSTPISPSIIRWDTLKIKEIPFEAGQLNFTLHKKNMTLDQKTSIPLLGGVFSIDQFSLKHNINTDPSVYFKGKIKNISLNKLTQALGWPLLTGNISGDIPGVEYTERVLKISGGLKINIFDGIITIDKLSSSGLFTDFSKFHMDMNVNNIDLHQLTKKLEMGDIKGRVSGFVNNLYLENWEPVTFYAWLGTPEDDSSSHRISQKAVKNITSIGGNGATDIISKGILSFFDTFGYDRLGFGCYLHQGVCQLMGVEAAEQGYYIIKGGGIPRIDVIGYNPQIDWKVLIKRLSRISNSSGL
jgi:hypothetical protein